MRKRAVILAVFSLLFMMTAALACADQYDYAFTMLKSDIDLIAGYGYATSTYSYSDNRSTVNIDVDGGP